MPPIVPVYFPFTYLSPPAEALLRRWFRIVAVYQPSQDPCPPSMQTAAAGGWIDLRVPLADDHARFLSCCDACRQWGRFHHGEDMSVLKAHLLAQTPFSSNDSTHAIRDTVRRGGRPPIDGSMPVSMVARIFLQLAQDFDVSRWEAGGGLRTVDAMEKDMFEQMLGEGSEVLDRKRRPPADADEDPGNVMVVERLAAWSILFETDPIDNALVVTDSTAVIDQVAEKAPTLTRVATFSAPPPNAGTVNTDTILDTVAGLVGSPEALSLTELSPPNGNDTPGLDLYVVPGISPRRFFLTLARSGNENDPPADRADTAFHTAIAHIRR